jgi:hypothetical protein
VIVLPSRGLCRLWPFIPVWETNAIPIPSTREVLWSAFWGEIDRDPFVWELDHRWKGKGSGFSSATTACHTSELKLSDFGVKKLDGSGAPWVVWVGVCANKNALLT